MDLIDKSDWIESKIYITFRHDPNEIDPYALANNEFQHIIESDGFGEIIDLEIK